MIDYLVAFLARIAKIAPQEIRATEIIAIYVGAKSPV
jgi:hypothetical protein